jgi:hypothetical protein
MPGGELIFEALQGGQKPTFDEKMKRRESQTRQNPSTEVLNRPRVFPIIDMAIITTGFAGCRSRPRPLENVNISQHLTTFSRNRCALRRISGNSEIDRLGTFQKPPKAIIVWHGRSALPFISGTRPLPT